MVLPLSQPVIVVIALYYGVGRWNDYFAAMMYLTKRAMYPLQLVLREILLQNQAGDMLHVATDAGYADRMIARMGLKYAVIVISTLPILVIFPFGQRFFAKGVMIGGALSIDYQYRSGSKNHPSVGRPWRHPDYHESLRRSVKTEPSQGHRNTGKSAL